jgi:hypothetical protein
MNTKNLSKLLFLLTLIFTFGCTQENIERVKSSSYTLEDSADFWNNHKPLAIIDIEHNRTELNGKLSFKLKNLEDYPITVNIVTLSEDPRDQFPIARSEFVDQIELNETIDLNFNITKRCAGKKELITYVQIGFEQYDGLMYEGGYVGSADNRVPLIFSCE